MREGRRSRVAALRAGLGRIGGPWSTSGTVLVLMGAVLVLDRLGTDLERTGAPVLLVSSALAGTLAISGIVLPARWTLLRGTADRPRPLTAILVLVVAGLTASLVGGIHDAAVGLPVDRSTAHLIERTVWAAGFLMILTFGTDALTEHRTQVARLTERASTLERARAEVTALRDVAIAADLARITAEVRSELAALDGEGIDGGLARLRRAGEELVRARSHELARPSTPYRPPAPRPGPARPNLSELIADVTADRPLRPILPTVTSAVWGVALTIGDVGPLRALEVGLVLGINAALSFGIVGAIADRLLRGRAPRGRLAIVALALPTAAIGWALGSRLVGLALGLPLPIGTTRVRLVVQALLMTAMPIAQGLGRAALRQGERAVEEMRAVASALELEVARANAELWERRRALSRALHGPVQAAMNAATLRVAGAGRDGSGLGAAIASARTMIEASLTELEQQFAGDSFDAGDDLGLAVTRIRGLWEDIADVEVDLTEEVAAGLAGDRTMTAALIDVLTEACSNAVRHGRARTIRARIDGHADHVLLEVVDDGRGESVGAPGVGSALLDEVTLSWQRTHDPGGTRLTAAFARP